ncbi:hypothetical protein ABZ599_15540 [Streptomyces misionensis]|uniref:hypothetical protein n=1 Tax=Streptomyces misionensis TaxID=67331 RepID=UPI0033E548DB
MDLFSDPEPAAPLPPGAAPAPSLDPFASPPARPADDPAETPGPPGRAGTAAAA